MPESTQKNSQKKKYGRGIINPAMKKHQWKEGQTGNPKGRPSNMKKLARFIREMGYEEVVSKDGSVKIERLKAVVLQAWNQAISGNKDARQFLFEYGWGKPVMSVLIDDAQGSVLEKFEQMDDDKLERIVREAERIVRKLPAGNPSGNSGGSDS